MKLFLKEIIKNIYAANSSELHKITLVFPNKRPGIFVAEYLSSIIDKPHWMPKVCTVSELMPACSDLKLADDILLISKLYKVFKNITGTNESFDNFYFWGELLLTDFNDIDKYLVDAKDLFRNLSSVKEIDYRFEHLSEEQVKAIAYFWQSFDKGKLTTQKENFLKIWNKLYDVYISFKELLTSENIAYEGMIYRDVVNNIKNGKKINTLSGKFVFIGFNALSKCEEELFEYLQKTKKATFYWDYDTLYVQNTIHEAGRFIRKNRNDFPSQDIKLNFENILLKNKNVTVTAVPSDVAQTTVCFDILKNIPPDEYSETVVVLADEYLLLPMLYSIPEQITNLNITMGYPLENTPAYSFINAALELQKNIKQKKSKHYFFYKDVLNVLNHRYLSENAIALSIVADIHKYNKIYLSAEEFAGDEIITSLFRVTDKPEKIGEYLLEVLYKLNIRFSESDDNLNTAIEQEYTVSLYKLINRLNETLLSLEYEFSIETYYKLLQQFVQNKKINFEGEPLQGLQIMGLLETRVLDFKNVIVLSMNEGTLPKINSAPSFIPYNIRKAFEMPTTDHQDAIYAYTFYRLIQRAENINLIYSNVASGLVTGERSRYINQMKYNNKFNIIEKFAGFNIDFETKKAITIKKDAQIINVLQNYYKKEKRRLSPSAISAYLNCPLQFYFKYIAGIEETELISEEVDGMIFGNMYHTCMQNIYEKFCNKIINAHDIESILENTQLINRVVENAFKKDYFNNYGNTEIEGRNILIFDILKKYIIQTLKNDKINTPFRIIELEGEYELKVNIGGDKNIKLFGKIDRIDQKDGTIRIIDYKTGMAKLTYQGIDKLFSSESKERNNAVMQVFIYSCLFRKNKHANNMTVVPYIFILKDIFEQNFSFNIKEISGTRKYRNIDDFEIIEDDFFGKLKDLLSEIFNEDIPFYQTEDTESCKYCTFSEICGK